MGLLDDVQSATQSVKSTVDGVKAAYADDSVVPLGYVRARHILFLAGDGDADAKADRLATRIEAGEISFDDAALRFSACPTRDLNGALGTFPSLSRLREGTLRGGRTPYDGQDTAPFDALVLSAPLNRICRYARFFIFGGASVRVRTRTGPRHHASASAWRRNHTSRRMAASTRHRPQCDALVYVPDPGAPE